MARQTRSKGRLVISAVCICCNTRDMAVRITKPPRVGCSSLENTCMKCSSINTYRLSLKGSDIKVETVYIKATDRGRELFKERTGEDFETFLAKTKSK